MSKFVSAHITTCMTRQDVDKLVKRFIRESDEQIQSIRVLCDTVAGRMLCEWEAPDQDSLVTWLSKRNVRIRGSDEWIIPVQMEAVEGDLKLL
ncbi:MAG: hypothetical protein GKR87_08440 [Kiritimatiellae bacterium]|nr:hypothetical protein [Kiritimatiellia bacterium]